MNTIGRSRPICRVAGVLTGLAAALAPITTGPAAVDPSASACSSSGD